MKLSKQAQKELKGKILPISLTLSLYNKLKDDSIKTGYSMSLIITEALKKKYN